MNDTHADRRDPVKDAAERVEFLARQVDVLQHLLDDSKLQLEDAITEYRLLCGLNNDPHIH